MNLLLAPSPLPRPVVLRCAGQVSEMVTDNELLKERLADAKRHFQAATAAEQQAREEAATLQAR